MKNDLIEPRLALNQLFSQGWPCIHDPLNFTSHMLELQGYTMKPYLWHFYFRELWGGTESPVTQDSL